jgi:hypothetical protein
MLEVVSQRKNNPPAFGELFYACYEEIQNMTLKEAFILLLELFK